MLANRFNVCLTDSLIIVFNSKTQKIINMILVRNFLGKLILTFSIILTYPMLILGSVILWDKDFLDVANDTFKWLWCKNYY